MSSCRIAFGVGSGLLLLICGPALAAAAASVPPRGQVIAEHGLGPAVPSCESCHGKNFTGDASRGAPALVGRSASLLMDTLYSMATNPKDHTEMARIARHLDMAQRAAVTAWLSRLPAKP